MLIPEDSSKGDKNQEKMRISPANIENLRKTYGELTNIAIQSIFDGGKHAVFSNRIFFGSQRDGSQT
jgi:hypothetical protein